MEWSITDVTAVGSRPLPEPNFVCRLVLNVWPTEAALGVDQPFCDPEPLLIPENPTYSWIAFPGDAHE